MLKSHVLIVVMVLSLPLGLLMPTQGSCQQPAYLKSSNSETGDRFGHSVSVSGDTLVVGAVGEDSNATTVNGDETNNIRSDSGAVYAFVKSGPGTWSQQAYVKVSNPGGFGFPNIGHAVSISGDTFVVGSPWIVFNAEGARGAVYVFVRNGNTWSEEAFFQGSNTGNADSFGYSVAISGDTLVVGDYFEGSSATGVNGNENDDSMPLAGAAYVFVRGQGGWTQQAYLKASNTGAGDYFGYSVAISGDTIVVGAPLEDSSVTGVDSEIADNDAAETAGAAYVFTRNQNDVWSQAAYLKASNTDAADEFGFSVSLSGDTIVVGADGEDSNASGINGDEADNSASRSGAVYVFTENNLGEWSQQSYIKASNSGAGDLFGRNISLSNDTLAVGAEFEDDLVTDSGATYVFVRDEVGDWSELAKAKASNAGLADRFGFSTAVSGDILVTGTYFEDSDATGINGDGSNNLAKDSGAAYAFTVSSLTAEDTTPPVVTPPPDVFAVATGEFTLVELGTATAEDDSGVVDSIVNDWPGGGFPVGQTTVTWTATDPSGNQGQATQLVMITPGEPSPCPESVFCDGFEGD